MDTSAKKVLEPDTIWMVIILMNHRTVSLIRFCGGVSGLLMGLSEKLVAFFHPTFPRVLPTSNHEERRSMLKTTIL